MEVLSTCPTNWGLTPEEALEWLRNNMMRLGGADGGQVPVPLVGEDDPVGQGPFQAGGDGRGPAVGGLHHVTGKVVVGHHRAAHRVCEMLATLSGVAYAERVSVDTVPNIRKAKAAIKKAFETQIAKKGFSIVEVLSTCPTNWGLTPEENPAVVTSRP